MDLNTKHVQRNTLPQQVIEHIILLLREGKIKSGHKLPSELELMPTLGVSRPVLREALGSLETLEIINRKLRGGTYINEKVGSFPFRAMLALSINNVSAIIEARMTLELGLVTLAAEKITEKHLESLQAAIQGIEQSPNNNYGSFDKKFHRIIAESVDNPVVEGMIDSLLIAHERTDSLIPYREPSITIEHHTAIYEALKNHNPIESFKQMYNHLSFVREKVLYHYNTQSF